MIRCAETNLPINTGLHVDRRAYELGDPELPRESVTACPHCGRQHLWQSADAYFEEE